MTAPTIVGGKLEAATRISTVAKTLDDGFGLQAYAAATTLAEIATRPALRNRLALTDPAAGWRAFKSLHEDAQKLRGKPEAEQGTNIHSAVEAITKGRDISGIDPSLRADAEAALAELGRFGLDVVETETFGVVTGLAELCAGTRDAVVQARSGIHYVVDFKSVGSLGTGEAFSGVAWATQLALYSWMDSYRHDFTRDRWDRPMINRAKISPATLPVSTSIGIVIEIERDAAAVNLHRLDLEAGLRYAELALEVRTVRRQKSAPFL